MRAKTTKHGVTIWTYSTTRCWYSICLAGLVVQEFDNRGCLGASQGSESQVREVEEGETCRNKGELLCIRVECGDSPTWVYYRLSCIWVCICRLSYCSGGETSNPHRGLESSPQAECISHTGDAPSFSSFFWASSGTLPGIVACISSELNQQLKIIDDITLALCDTQFLLFPSGQMSCEGVIRGIQNKLQKCKTTRSL